MIVREVSDLIIQNQIKEAIDVMEDSVLVIDHKCQVLNEKFIQDREANQI